MVENKGIQEETPLGELNEKAETNVVKAHVEVSTENQEMLHH